MFSLNYERINFQNLIGSGRFGNVYPYQKNPEDDKWVVKVQHSISNNLPHKMQEIVLGFSLMHPNVLPIKGFHMDFNEKENNWKIYTKMPRMTGTLRSELDTRIKQNKFFSEKEIISYFYDITCGLAYLHQRKIVHRDIKLDNVLLDKKGLAVVSDVGIGKLIEDETTYLTAEKAGAPMYLAPEVLEAEAPMKKGALYKADAWSLGMEISELCLLKSKVLKSFLSGKQKEEFMKQQLEAAKENYESSVFIDLVLSLLKWNPLERITVFMVKKELEEHYGHILSPRSHDQSVQTEPLFEEQKNVEAENFNPDLNTWQGKMEAIKKELEKIKGDLFSIDLKTSNEDVGIRFRPKEATRINDEQFKKLITDFTDILKVENWPKYRVLVIILDKCELITDDSLSELSIQVGSKLTNLNCKKITDKGLKDLSIQMLSNLKHLQNLQISFYNCPHVTDRGTQELVNKVTSNLIHLKIFCLNLSSCPNITESAVQQMVNQIATKLKNLKEIFLYLYGICIPEQTQEALRTELKKFKGGIAF